MANGTLSIVGGGTLNPISTLATALEIGGAGAVAPVLRIGSGGNIGTIFNNVIKATQNGTVEHLTGTTDTLSGARFSIAAAKTLVVNVVAGRLVINGDIADPLSSALRGGTLKKTGNSTTLQLNGTTFLAGINAAEGRLELLGQLKLNSNPVIGASGTLSLQNTSAISPNSLPATISIPRGTLEGLPGAFGAASNVLNLTGGTLNLGIGGAVSGLSAHLYNGNDNSAHSAFGGPDLSGNTYTTYVNYFAGRDAAQIPGDILTATGAGGVTHLSFGTGLDDTAMFATIAPSYTANDNIVARLNGRIIITTPGTYTFATDSDDGSMLYVDGATVVSNNAYQGHFRSTGKIQLSAGLHDIDIGYYEGGGLNGLIVDYAGPDTGDAQTVIPNAVLLPSNQLQLTFANAINVIQNSVINTLSVGVPGATLSVGKALNVNGTRLDLGVLTLTGGAGTYMVNANTPYGQVNARSIVDGGAAVALVNHGPGTLIIESGVSPQLQNAGSSVTVDVGSLGLVRGAGQGSPTGNATVNVPSHRLILSSRGGPQSFAQPFSFSGGGDISAQQIGTGVPGTAGSPMRAALVGNVALNAGATLTLSSRNDYIPGLAVSPAAGASTFLRVRWNRPARSV